MPTILSPAALLKQTLLFSLGALGRAAGQAGGAAGRPVDGAADGVGSGSTPADSWTQLCLRQPSCAPRIAAQHRSAQFWRRQAAGCQEGPTLCAQMRWAADGAVAAIEEQARRWTFHQVAASTDHALTAYRSTPVDGIVYLDDVAADEGDFEANLLRSVQQAQAERAIAIVALRPGEAVNAGRARRLLATQAIKKNWRVAVENVLQGQSSRVAEGLVDGQVPVVWGVEDPFVFTQDAAFRLIRQLDHGEAAGELFRRIVDTMVAHPVLAEMATAACATQGFAELEPLCDGLDGLDSDKVAAAAAAWQQLPSSGKSVFLRAYLQLTADLLQRGGIAMQAAQAFLRDPSEHNARRFQTVNLEIYRARSCATQLRQLQHDNPHHRIIALVAAPQASLVRGVLEILLQETSPPPAPPAGAATSCPARPAA